MTKTQLLDLPNELLSSIFEYLTSVELVITFFGLQSHRIQALIQPLISSLNISKQDDQWIENYLPNVLVQRRIIELRLQGRQIHFLTKYFSMGNIQSIRVNSLELDGELFENDLIELRQCLKKLSIHTSGLMGNDKLIQQLFSTNSTNEYFRAYGQFCYPTNVEMNIFPHLTYISIELRGMRGLFVLLCQLPNLEELEINFPYQYRRDRAALITKVENVIPCKNLRHATLTGYANYFDCLDRFFAAFGSTIESLTLNLTLEVSQPDGEVLERDLLNQMPRLSSFDFLLLAYPLAGDEANYIKTFQTVAWQKFNPIMFWSHRFEGDFQRHFSICTLPYKYDHFCMYSNESIPSFVYNRPTSLSFERVRSVSVFEYETPIILETFELIRDTFLNVRTLRLYGEMDDFESAYYAASGTEKSRLFSDDLLSNKTIQLLSVTQLYATLDFDHYDNQNLSCIFHLLPNLTTLRTNNLHYLLNSMKKPKYYDDFVMFSLNRIKLEAYDRSDW